MTNSFSSLRRKPLRPAWNPIAPVAAALVLCAVTAAVPRETRAQIAGTGIPEAQEDLVAASLVCDAEAIVPGRGFRLAVRLAPNDGWHLNWQNPGDAGLAPSVKWNLPDGFKAGPPCWPFPERFRAGPLVIFGYSGELLLVVDVRTPQDLSTAEPLEFKAEVSWLACADACVPGSADVTLTLPVRGSSTPDPARSAGIEASRARCPRPSLEWNVEAHVDDQGTLALDISAGAESAKIEDVFFYPYDPGLIENASPQRLSVLAGPYGRAAYQLRVELSRMAAAIPARLTGILVSRSGWSRGGGAQAIEIDVPLGRP